MKTKAKAAKHKPIVARVRFRSGWSLLAWLVWGGLEVLFGQAALASYAEYEPRAGLIFSGFTVVLGFAGLTYWLVRRNDWL